jgi:hypothetical protein
VLWSEEMGKYIKECVLVMWDIYIYIYIIYGLDYVRSKEKTWKRKEVKKSIGTENEKLM